jgi:hypothetical protein
MKMTGARFLAESLDAYGVTHLFHVPTILSRTMVEIEERTSIGRVVTHGEKATRIWPTATRGQPEGQESVLLRWWEPRISQPDCATPTSPAPPSSP